MRGMVSVCIFACAVACDPKDGGGTGQSAGTGEGTVASGDTGDGAYGGNCVEQPTVLGDLQQVGITGVSAADVLAEASGVYAGTLAWMVEGPLDYLGSTQPTALTIEIAYAGGEIRSIDAVLVEPCQHEGPCPCEDSLEVDVTWRLSTADGVLDETWTAPLVHQPGSLFMGGDLGITHDFLPDDTQGSLSAASFALDPGVTLETLFASADLDSGAASGSIWVEVLAEEAGWFGAGQVAPFAAVREVTPAACNAFTSEQACADVGCTVVQGRRVWTGGNACGCDPPTPYCFAAPIDADPTPTLYTRPGFEGYDDVVAFDGLVDPAPELWRLCSAAPEVVDCACDIAVCE